MGDVIYTIEYLPYMGDLPATFTNNTVDAFHVADSYCFNATNGDRDDADNVLIIATDGNSFPDERLVPAMHEANKLKSKGIKTVAVGITSNVPKYFLELISGESYYVPPGVFNRDYYRARNFDELNVIQDTKERLPYLVMCPPDEEKGKLVLF